MNYAQNNNTNDKNNKKFVKIEIKKRFNPFEQRRPALNIQKEVVSKEKQSIIDKLNNSDAAFKRALFFGDKVLANKIKSEQAEYRKALLLSRTKQNPQPTDNRIARNHPQGLRNPNPISRSRTPFIAPQLPTPSSKPPVKKDIKKTSRFNVAPKPKMEAPTNVRISSNMLGSIDSDDLNLDRKNIRSIAAMNRAREKQRRGFKAQNFVQRDVTITDNMNLKDLSAAMSVTSDEVIRRLREIDFKANTESLLSADIAEFLIKEFGHRAKVKHDILSKIKIAASENVKNDSRPPIVAVVGHVDHGKTSLLDALRKTNFASKEEGGITQSIGASQVYLGKDFVTFIDTPGHKLFANMRAKGMDITDIILIIIAADDGIKEQTIESIRHAKSTKALLIIVITKSDKGGDLDKIRRSLLDYDIVVEPMGGDVPEISVSSKTGENLKELLALIIMTGEMLELKANNTVNASGKILDSYLDKFKGPVANVIIQNGTLKKNDHFIAGPVVGKAKLMTDWKGNQLTEAKPSFIVQVSGFAETASAGDDFIVMQNQSDAREAATKRSEILRNITTEGALYSINDIWNKLIDAKEVKEMNFIIRAESFASSEALAAAIGYNDGRINRIVIYSGIGAITESDVAFAKTSDAKIIAFRVKIPPLVEKAAEQAKIIMKKYDVIYQILDDIDTEIDDMFAPKETLVEIGKAQIRKVFNKPKLIAGCIVTDGIIKRNMTGALFRNGEEIGRGRIISMKQIKDDVKESKAGQECGIFIEECNDYQVDDIIKCFEIIKK